MPICVAFGEAAALAIGIRAMMMLGNSTAAQDPSGVRARRLHRLFPALVKQDLGPKNKGFPQSRQCGTLVAAMTLCGS